MPTSLSVVNIMQNEFLILRHYSMLIQGSPTNGTFEWINPYKYRNPTITSMTVLFQPK